MKHVSIESIEKALVLVDQASDDVLDEKVNEYAQLQPALFDYVMAAPKEYENVDLEGLVIYYFWVLIEAFKQEGLELNEISYETIDAFQEPFAQWLDSYFQSEDEEEFESFCDQPNLTQFMSIEISNDDDDGSSLDDETATQLYMVGMAIISLLNDAIKA